MDLAQSAREHLDTLIGESYRYEEVALPGHEFLGVALEEFEAHGFKTASVPWWAIATRALELGDER